MILAPPGYWAIYKEDNEVYWERVIAFNSDGTAMILDKASGCLELVDDAINFKGIKFDMIKWNSIKVEN